MARILVGLSTFQGDVAKIAKRFDMVEVRPIDTSTPRVATLRAWRRSVPPAFVFSVVLPRVVGELGAGPEVDKALATSLDVAAALEARCMVLATPASVRPTATNRKRLAAMLSNVQREGVVLAWEPAGLWEAEEVVAAARASGVIAVLDAAREALPPGPIAYTRLRNLGKGNALGAATLERVASRLRGRREAFVVVGSPGDANRIRAALALAAGARPAAAATIVRPGSSALAAEDEEQ